MKITHSYTRFWLHANPGNKVVSPSECSTRHNASCVWSSKLQKCTLKNQFQNPFLNVIYSYSINPYSYSTNLLQSTQTILLGPTEVQWASSGFWLMRMHFPVPWGFFIIENILLTSFQLQQNFVMNLMMYSCITQVLFNVKSHVQYLYQIWKSSRNSSDTVFYVFEKINLSTIITFYWV